MSNLPVSWASLWLPLPFPSPVRFRNTSLLRELHKMMFALADLSCGPYPVPQTRSRTTGNTVAFLSLGVLATSHPPLMGLLLEQPYLFLHSSPCGMLLEVLLQGHLVIPPLKGFGLLCRQVLRNLSPTEVMEDINGVITHLCFTTIAWEETLLAFLFPNKIMFCETGGAEIYPSHSIHRPEWKYTYRRIYSLVMLVASSLPSKPIVPNLLQLHWLTFNSLQL